MKNQPSNPKSKTNDDFWDLGDDDLDLEKLAEEKPVEPAATPVLPETREPARAPQDLEAPSRERESDPATPAPKAAPKRGHTSSPTSGPGPTSTMEKGLLAALTVSLAGLAYWGITAFFNNAPNGEVVEFIEDFPIKGEKITIETVETWWREPVREGDDPDVGVVIDAKLIPCAKIKLVASGSASLQVSFRDGEDKLIGDTMNLTVEDGKFGQSGSDEIDVHATSGFRNPARFNAYVNADIAAWSVVIVEDSRTETPLVRARLEANRKETK
jgi:hypothetical protein